MAWRAPTGRVVAQKVAHEVLPGLGLLDLIVNPLVIRAFTREQELAADGRAVETLRAMGHATPRQTLGSALRAAAGVNGPVRGGRHRPA